ncbi:hypothetical protein BV25DRAFT_1922469 [Artomyces pyxidatus]|uniref:Uncharacterized protein n=1 Tax=Artomyces pyxidatus TaxID=48021 RepID=A0ACB8SFJ6_9AGAM|nr:hypothetical protein BV25DRAFT_1922469 [Artomyces pyxidatus]
MDGSPFTSYMPDFAEWFSGMIFGTPTHHSPTGADYNNFNPLYPAPQAEIVVSADAQPYDQQDDCPGAYNSATVPGNLPAQQDAVDFQYNSTGFQRPPDFHSEYQAPTSNQQSFLYHEQVPRAVQSLDYQAPVADPSSTFKNGETPGTPIPSFSGGYNTGPSHHAQHAQAFGQSTSTSWDGYTDNSYTVQGPVQYNRGFIQSSSTSQFGETSQTFLPKRYESHNAQYHDPNAPQLLPQQSSVLSSSTFPDVDATALSYLPEGHDGMERYLNTGHMNVDHYTAATADTFAPASSTSRDAQTYGLPHPSEAYEGQTYYMNAAKPSQPQVPQAFYNPPAAEPGYPLQHDAAQPDSDCFEGWDFHSDGNAAHPAAAGQEASINAAEAPTNAVEWAPASFTNDFLELSDLPQPPPRQYIPTSLELRRQDRAAQRARYDRMSYDPLSRYTYQHDPILDQQLFAEEFLNPTAGAPIQQAGLKAWMSTAPYHRSLHRARSTEQQTMDPLDLFIFGSDLRKVGNAGARPRRTAVPTIDVTAAHIPPESPNLYPQSSQPDNYHAPAADASYHFEQALATAPYTTINPQATQLRIEDAYPGEALYMQHQPTSAMISPVPTLGQHPPSPPPAPKTATLKQMKPRKEKKRPTARALVDKQGQAKASKRQQTAKARTACHVGARASTVSLTAQNVQHSHAGPVIADPGYVFPPIDLLATTVGTSKGTAEPSCPGAPGILPASVLASPANPTERGKKAKAKKQEPRPRSSSKRTKAVNAIAGPSRLPNVRKAKHAQRDGKPQAAPPRGSGGEPDCSEKYYTNPKLNCWMKHRRNPVELCPDADGRWCCPYCICMNQFNALAAGNGTVVRTESAGTSEWGAQGPRYHGSKARFASVYQHIPRCEELRVYVRSRARNNQMAITDESARE